MFFIENFNLIFFTILFLFLIGLLGIILIDKNILITIMSIELMLLAINLNFILISFYINDINGFIICLFILIISAAEAAIGLAIIINYYRLNGTISYNLIQNLKG
jgi:NADH-quinone oxidoreductase subunit K